MGRIAKSMQGMRRETRKASKGAKSRLPEPQVLRIMNRHVTGESNRAIAREEKVDRKTAGKIIRSQEMQELVQECRARFYALLPDAIDAVQHALRVKKDARMGYQLLTVMRVVPTLEEITPLLRTQPPQSLSDEAREKLYASLSPSDQQILRVLRMVQAKGQAYGVNLLPDIPEAGTGDASAGGAEQTSSHADS